MYFQYGGLFWPSAAAAFLKVQILLMKETAHFNDRKLHNILLAQWRVFFLFILQERNNNITTWIIW